jgi:hypothetical protein
MPFPIYRFPSSYQWTLYRNVGLINKVNSNSDYYRPMNIWLETVTHLSINP